MEPEDSLDASTSSILLPPVLPALIAPMLLTKSPQVMGPVPSLEIAPLPKLMLNGVNWVTFKRRMTIDIKARAHLIWHLEGWAPHPKAPVQPKGKPTQQEQDEYEEKLKKYEDAVDLWRTCDAIVKWQIIHNIPDTVLIHIQNLSTAANMWDALQREFEGRTTFVQNDLQHKISLAKCRENENVHEHTDRMQYMFEELAGMGVMISDDEYLAMLMRSMPNTYANFLAPIISSAHAGGNPLTPYALMDYAVSEYDWRLIVTFGLHSTMQIHQTAPFPIFFSS